MPTSQRAPAPTVSASTHKAQVRRFYDVLWNAHDLDAVPTVLHEDCAFRGSLGDEKRGHAGFREYVDSVHAALGGYRCTIRDLVAEGDRVFARMTFGGVHRGDLRGHRPTGHHVEWSGAALFTFREGLISQVWVLGDLAGLDAQLERNAR